MGFACLCLGTNIHKSFDSNALTNGVFIAKKLYWPRSGTFAKPKMWNAQLVHPNWGMYQIMFIIK